MAWGVTQLRPPRSHLPNHREIREAYARIAALLEPDGSNGRSNGRSNGHADGNAPLPIPQSAVILHWRPLWSGPYTLPGRGAAADATTAEDGSDHCH